MAETEMVKRVARAIDPIAWENFDTYCRAKGYSLDEIEDRKRNSLVVARTLKNARAAIEAIFKGSRFAEFDGKTVIANPDFPAHYWDGEQLRPVLDAALSPPSKD